MIKSLNEFMHLLCGYRSYLVEAGVEFDDDGFLVIERGSFAENEPDFIVEYERRNSLGAAPSRTAICFFESDERILRRFERLLDDIAEYKRFYAVCEPDLTVTADMDIEWQSVIMLANRLFVAILAVNGIKVIPNTRCGSAATRTLLSKLPSGLIWVSSSLGCKPAVDGSDLSFAAKMLRIRPRSVLLYGKEDPVVSDQLNRLGIESRRYPDAHAARRLSARGLDASA